ncbi:MAG: NUDIX hydrolase [Oscillospiraceae bacterium]|jgi:ADP-ribose pyrophosphatase|nr:NUDIX hydrolase [Oscillospiraceae bacterium]
MPDDSGLIERTKAQHIVYQGRILTIRRDEVYLPDGREAFRELVSHPGAVAVCALTEQNEVLLVRQFRYAYGEVLLEVPAGKLERGEDPFAAVQRELEEETGAAGTDWAYLGQYYSSVGFCDERIHFYKCRVTAMGAAHPDEDEYLHLVKMPLAEARQLVLDGKIPDGKSQALLLRVSVDS